MSPFLISSMVLGLLNQLQMFWQLDLSDRIARALHSSGATRAVAHIQQEAFGQGLVC